MAKINGICTGTSAVRYDVWIDVIQNSQDLLKNQSNVTVSLKLQRNDGYADSAYNLSEDSNSFSLSVGGKVKSSGTRGIDTRNSAVVVLATWTGEVSHDDKGELLLSVSGSFTMGSTGLKSGSVSGSFKCTKILRASSLSLGDTTWITPGDSFSFSIIGSSSFSHKISCQIGNNPKQLTECDEGEMTGNITIPKSWSSYVNDTKMVVLNIVLGTYDGDELIGYKKYGIYFIVPNTTEYAPAFDVVIEKINNGVPEEWDGYISGISQFNASFSNAEYKYGADFKSVSIEYNGITKNMNGSCFNVTGSGEQTISVCVTDTRGNYLKKEVKINTFKYSPPKINISSLKLCDENGVIDKKGKYLRVEYSSSFSDIFTNNAQIVLKYNKLGNFDEKEYIITTDSPLIIGEGEILHSSAYVVTMVITDSLGRSEKYSRKISPVISLNIKLNGRGAGFGGYATEDGVLQCYWDFDVKGKFRYEPVTVTISEAFEEFYSYARYYQCFDMVYIRMRLTVKEAIPANTDYMVAVVQNKAPMLFTPLGVYSPGLLLSGGVKYKTGEITVTSPIEIAKGTNIYINGIYLADNIITEG